jgi:IclR family KDG regulon transcriptional repressor
VPEPRASALRAALDVLLALSAETGAPPEGLGVSDLAAITGREKSQVSRFLRGFSDYALVERDPETRKFRLGPRIYSMANQLTEHRLYASAPGFLRQLVADVGESAHLSVLSGREVLTIASELPSHHLRSVDRAGQTFPLHSSSAGRALLFDEDRAGMERALASNEFPLIAPNAPTTIDEVWERLVRDRARGFTINDEESEAGLLGLGAPIRNFESRIVAAVNVSGPRFRLLPHHEEAGRRVVEVARGLTEATSEASGPQPGKPLVEPRGEG